MKIELKKIKVREISKNYINNDDEGVSGYEGKLNIRPKYQREFVYKDKQRNAVIETINSYFPLNVMYWAKNNDNTFEVIDGQQRTISFCEYITGNFSINYEGNPKAFHNLTKEEQNKILNYELMIYVCEGTDKEKLDWFKIINIAGEKLTDQELRNAIYTGKWLIDAKKKFSKNGCPAYSLASDYISGSTIRQDYLEKVLKWIINRDKKDSIEDYMSEYQNKPNANDLWLYFTQVITWVKTIFPCYRKEMKGIDWGILYNKFHKNEYNNDLLEKEIKSLMIDEDVTTKKGIYEYILSRDEKYLNIRKFSEAMKRSAYEKQNGICNKCQIKFDLSQMEADHITPWSQNGKTIIDNCQMLCRDCNRRKSNI